MSWYDEAVFYHIYPLGLTGAPKQNDYGEPVHRLKTIVPWIGHMRELGCSALYIGPLFESVGHGYETTDYRKLDSRLGTNEDLKDFVAECHRQGIRVILDGVFNHVGRDFFAFRDLKENRENSPYRDWFCNVNFWGNNEYNDGFSYDNWGGYNLLVKLNQRNGEVQDYLCDSIRMWVSEFDIDGLRLDAADVLDFGFMQTLRRLADEVKPDFWLMGEVIHGDYTRWVGPSMLHSVTDYNLHKALYSGHNDHNYFEIAHTVKRLYDMGLNRPGGSKLYSFADNHDVERIYTRLSDKANFMPLHILLFTLPGIPSIYYGSEFGIEGRKESWSDDSLRPALSLEDFKNALKDNPYTKLIAALGHLHLRTPALQDGDYRELSLTTRQYAFARSKDGCDIIIAANNDSEPAEVRVPALGHERFVGALSGQKIRAEGDTLTFTVPANLGEIWVPEESYVKEGKPVFKAIPAAVKNPAKRDAAGAAARRTAGAPDAGKTAGSADAGKTAGAPEAGKTAGADIKKPVPVPEGKSYEEMTVEELQSVILGKMEKNGPVTDQMRRDVENNIWHDSLVNWARSF